MQARNKGTFKCKLSTWITDRDQQFQKSETAPDDIYVH